jgi:hypothetical protein
MIRRALIDVSSTRLGTKRPLQQKLTMTIQQRTKHTSLGKEARQAISVSSRNGNKSSSLGASDAANDNIFGMRPIDYSILPPIRASPPPPPSKPGLQKYIAPASMIFMAATVAYFYVNNKNDNFEYWEAMQSGSALQTDDDDDDEEDEEDE